MLDARQLASNLCSYVRSAGTDCTLEDFIFCYGRKNPEILGLSIGFSVKPKGYNQGIVDIFLESSFLDNSYLEYISNSPNNKQYLHFTKDSGLNSVFDKIEKSSVHFSPSSFEMFENGFKVSGSYPLDSTHDEVFDAVLNRCLRPSWLYVRRMEPR